MTGFSMSMENWIEGRSQMCESGNRQELILSDEYGVQEVVDGGELSRKQRRGDNPRTI